MAVDEEVSGLLPPLDSAAERASEVENRLDVAAFRQNHAGERLDYIVETQNGAMVGLVGLKRLRLGTIGVQNGQNMRHRADAVLRQFVKAADR